jgi:hypothetical protein
VKLNLALVVGIAALTPLSAFAQNEITAVPNRPTVSTTAQPVQLGVLETEWGVDAAASHQDLNGLLKFGVTTNLELRFASNPITADSGTHGFGDVSAGFKYRLTRDHDHQPSVALMYMFKAPTAGSLLGSGYPDNFLALLVSKDIGKHHFDYNVIGNFLGTPNGGWDHDILNALAWSHPTLGNWGIDAELSGTTPSSAGLPGSAQLIVSATYTARSRLVFDIGMMGRLAGPIPHAMFMGGVTYSVAELYHPHRQHSPKAFSHLKPAAARENSGDIEAPLQPRVLLSASQ